MRRRDELSLSPHDRADRPRRRPAPEPPSAHVSRTRRRPSAFAWQGRIRPAHHQENAVWGFATTRSATLIASYLVERNEVPAFVAAVADVRGRHPALDVSCTGPWAPYSFVTARSPEAWS